MLTSSPGAAAPARGSPRRPAQEDRILRAPAFAVILRLKLAGDSSRVCRRPLVRLHVTLFAWGVEDSPPDGLKSELRSPHRRAAKREASKGVFEPICAVSAITGRGLTGRRVAPEGRIFVGLRKFEATQEAVFRRPRARPFVEGGVAPALTDQASKKAKPKKPSIAGRLRALSNLFQTLSRSPFEAARRPGASQPPGD